jgi:HSP20 family protein
MNSNVKDIKKHKDVAPASSRGDVVSFDDFGHFFDDFLSRRWPRLLDWDFPAMNFPKMAEMEKGVPKVDIIDHDHELEVQAALPGVKKEDLDVTVTKQMITIRTSTKAEKEEKKNEGKYFRREITRGEYQRTLSLPDYVDADNAKATFKDGILKVMIPKTEKGKRKSIEIK